MAPDFAQRAPFRGKVTGLPREHSGVRRTQEGLWAHGHLAERMEAWAAWGAAHDPLAGRRVLEFALSTPPDLYWRRGYSRYLFRQAMEGVLPPKVQWERSKYDAAVESRRRSIRRGAWRALAREVNAGLWDGEDPPWIDVPRLRDELRGPPETLPTADLLRSIRIRTGLQMKAFSEHR